MEWRKGPIIGRGSYATVSLATTATGDLIAVKSVELASSRFLQKEQHLLSRLRSPHIIEYIGFDVDYSGNNPMYNLFMEYAPGGTISDVIKKQGGSLDESLIRCYAHQILLGLDYLHSNNLVHCDIKSQNILIGKDGVKIGDLGCAKLVEKGGATASAFSGTPVFMAPEVARGEEQGFAADVWALGCAVIEMATGSNPWPQINDPVSALYRIGHSGEVPLFPVWLSAEAKDFLDKCLKRDCKERGTAKELLGHPFVNSNSGLESSEAFAKNSPTSILEQGFWYSLDVSEPSPPPTQSTNLSGDSPVERVRRLAVATPSTSSCLPNWADEEDWITVRINHVGESSKLSEQNLQTDLDDDGGSSRTESFLFSNFYVEEEELDRPARMSGIVMSESHVLEANQESVTNVLLSRFLDCKNKNNKSYLFLDSNLSFALFAHRFLFLFLRLQTSMFT